MLKALEAENEVLRQKTSALLDQVTVSLHRNRDMLPSDERDSIADILVLLQEQQTEPLVAKGMISSMGLAQALHTMERRRNSRFFSLLQEGQTAQPPPVLPAQPPVPEQTDPEAPPVADLSGNVAPFNQPGAAENIVKDLQKKMKEGMAGDAIAQAVTDQAQKDGGGATDTSTAPLKEKLMEGEISPQEFQVEMDEKLAQKPGSKGMTCDMEHEECKKKANGFLEICVKGHRMATYKSGTARYIRRDSHKLTLEMEGKYQDEPTDGTGGEGKEEDGDAKDAGKSEVEDTPESFGGGGGDAPGAAPAPGSPEDPANARESPMDPSSSTAMQTQMVQESLASMNKGMMAGG